MRLAVRFTVSYKPLYNVATTKGMFVICMARKKVVAYSVDSCARFLCSIDFV